MAERDMTVPDQFNMELLTEELDELFRRHNVDAAVCGLLIHSRCEDSTYVETLTVNQLKVSDRAERGIDGLGRLVMRRMRTWFRFVLAEQK